MAKAETELLEDDNDLIEDQDETQNDDDELPEDDQDTDLEADNDNDAEDTEGQDDDEDDEIVLDGDDGSHPKDEQRGIRKRVNKLNAKNAKSEARAEQSTAELEVERERNRLLQLALDQQNAPVDGPPDPNDFDDGVNDAEYIKANNGYIIDEVAKRQQKTQQSTQIDTEAQTSLKRRQFAHYKRSDTLKVKDYDETEDKAIAVLGQKVINEIIKEFDRSPEILYYLGKTPKEVDSINDMILNNQTMKAVARIGVLDDRLKTRRKAKNKPAPDPDGELSGGGSGKPRGERGPKGATFE